ncbi:MAG: pyruvate formate lyase family protein [Tepidanaerobacteraceae bacterium]
MSERIERLKRNVMRDTYPIGIEKFKIVMDTVKETTGDPVILTRAKIIANVMDRMPIFIQDDELIVGNGASMPCGLEIDPDYGIWEEDEIQALIDDGFEVKPEDAQQLKELNERHRPVTLVDSMNHVIKGNERLMAFMRSGMILPPWREKAAGGGGGYAMSGLGLGPGLHLLCIDYEIPIKKGLKKVIEECKESLRNLRFFKSDSYERSVTLQSMIIALEAIIRLADRFSALATEMASKEKDPQRKKELEEIAEICKRVPAYPARNFKEALQSFWFIFLAINPSPTASMGRLDQYLYPYYKEDIAKGKITDEEVLEYLQCLRIKDMELNRISGKQNRLKNSGMAKWHNATIGGVKPDGSDACNRITELLLDALMACPTPHHTLTLRIADSTPSHIINKALKAIRQGCSMPAFVSDKSYINFFTRHGVSIEDARDFVMTGCLDGNIPGRTRTIACGMFIVPMVLDIFMNDGIDSKTGLKVLPGMGDPEQYKTYEDFEKAFKDVLAEAIKLGAEKSNIENIVNRERFPCPVRSAFFRDGTTIGLDFHRRLFDFENSVVMNPVGMINLVNSLAAIKKVVFEDKTFSLAELKEALDANWEGYEEIRDKCVNVPKYGNDIDYVDKIASELYRYWAEVTETIDASYGGKCVPTGISVTSHQPGGALCNATPDGRFHKEILADGTVSPAQGHDVNGPTATLKSAMKIDQDAFQAMLHNMKFHPSAMNSEEDLTKLTNLIKVYFNNGGKHIQFNVVDAETLRKAQADPKNYRELVVRVAGFSAYFVQLSEAMQDEVINRTEHIAM